ncbi:NAD(P)-binding protein [Didymella exigua CBS 183.55]|uniref:NAD(P)-binding protein n=1 Tax=Didymella exigua CBS 183.55 TaxID=1150837 RepID=A0A6A5RK73_9PLEO|nr:NAD(P)-binding protein [Didymella exigua CBS 183.55]KAF1928029.1 NAD(P)-binding protein [Didymella exigua CBS 183.55]
MSKSKVVVTRNLVADAKYLLDARVDRLDIVQWQSDMRSWLLENVAGAAGLLVMVSGTINEELLEAAGAQLKAVATFTAAQITDCLSDAVADLAVMLALMAQRRVGKSMVSPQIRGATMGFLDFGRIPQAVLKRLIAFGIKRAIYVTSQPGKPVREDYYDLCGSGTPVDVACDLDQMANESGLVIVGCALTPETKHVISTHFFSKMKTTAVIVNIARGPIIDTNALVEALNQHPIFGAGLDVIKDEPSVAADHPILKQPRCVVLPRIGSATFQAREQMAIQSVQNLLAGLTGEDMVNEWNM